jgi:hypothetical protein
MTLFIVTAVKTSNTSNMYRKILLCKSDMTGNCKQTALRFGRPSLLLLLLGLRPSSLQQLPIELGLISLLGLDVNTRDITSPKELNLEHKH